MISNIIRFCSITHINIIPSYDRASAILNALIDLNMIEGNPDELKLNLYKLYNTKVLQVNKKGKATNSDIVECIKIMYGLYVNGTMISYVRKDKGLKKKRDDSRTVDKENVNRIPSKDRYNAIVEAMKHFDII